MIRECFMITVLLLLFGIGAATIGGAILSILSWQAARAPLLLAAALARTSTSRFRRPWAATHCKRRASTQTEA